MADNLSSKEQEIYDFIRSFVAEHHYPPTVREMCDAVGLSSTSTIHYHIKRMEEKGYLLSSPTKNRSLQLVDKSNSNDNKEMIEIPLIGEISAGQGIYAEENITDYYSLPIDFIHSNKEVFMLTIKGDSMINAGILNGDLVILEKCSQVNNGEIAAVLIDNQDATVKRFFKENKHYRLVPENDYMSPIITENAVIIGKVIGLLRTKI